MHIDWIHGSKSSTGRPIQKVMNRQPHNKIHLYNNGGGQLNINIGDIPQEIDNSVKRPQRALPNDNKELSETCCYVIEEEQPSGQKRIITEKTSKHGAT